MKIIDFRINPFGFIPRPVRTGLKAGLWLLAGLAAVACSEEKNEPIDRSMAVPAQVKDVRVEPLPGGAHLSYTLPPDKNLLYVEATVHTADGRKLDFRSSSYAAGVTILGLRSEAEEDVSLCSVSTSGVRSEPQTVRIRPLTPPFLAAYATLSAEPDFGGVTLSFENDSRSELAYFLGYYDAEGTFVDYESYYTFESGSYSYRGLEAKETRFGIYIRDKWDNTSDTLHVRLTPYVETRIPKDRFRAMKLLTDSEPNIGQWNVKMEYLWDGQYSQDYNDPYNLNSNYGWLVFTFRDEPTVEPRYFTFDMGVASKLSRIRLHHYFTYENSAPRICEFYGRADEPPIGGSEDGWIKLCRMEQVRPSLSGGVLSMSDAEAWERGTEAIVDRLAPPVRYIRVKAIEDWNGFSGWAASELTFFGQTTE